MDVDVEIISEDGDCPNPLFDSIMNAMNSMKEATADKIYQKIQRVGENTYSKPQVDRALANALSYGIFEKRNNRYRVRDDILDDEDTVYWNLNKKRMQTPFRFQEDYHDSQKGSKIDPEKDNKRFQDFKNHGKCPRCRRLKRPEKEKMKIKGKKDKKKKINQHNKGKTHSKKKNIKCKPTKLHGSKRKETLKKKPSPISLKKNSTRKPLSETRATMWAMNYPYLRSFSFEGSLNDIKTANNVLLGKATYDSTDSEEDTLSSPTDEQSFKSYPDDASQKFRDPYKEPRSVLSSEYDYVEDFGYSLPNKAKSNDSLKSDTNTDKSEISSVTHRSTTPSLSGLNIPSTSKNLNEKELAKYLSSGGDDLYSNKVDGSKNEKCNEKTDWMGCSDEPQTAIIQTKNVLTIEPMDSLTLKSPDYTSYVS